MIPAPVWLLLTKLFRGRHQLRGGCLQSPRKNVNVQQAHVPFATFDATDVGAMKTGDVSEGDLRQSRTLTKRAESKAEGVQLVN